MALIYIFQHFLSLLLISKFNKIYAYLSLFLFFIIFIFKTDTFDLISYERLFRFNQYQHYEYFFVKIIDFIRIITSDSRIVITLYQLFMIGVASSIIFYFRKQKLLTLAIIFSSVMFMLAINNNLRQGTSSIITLLGIISIFEGNKKLGFLLLMSSIGFHGSTVYFLLIISFLGLIFPLAYSIYYRDKNSMIFLYSICFSIAIISAYLIQYFTIMTKFYVYEGMNLTIDTHRTGLLLKSILILLSSLVVEMFLKFKKINFKIDLLRFLKLFFVLVVLSLSFDIAFDEIGSRILYYYFMFELGLLIYLINLNLYKTAVLILLSYMFAFNVINILGGI